MTPVLNITDMRITAGDEADAEATFQLAVPVLKLARGECLALVGPSGCGKSTLLEVLALLRPARAAERFELHAGTANAPLDLLQARDWSHLRQGPLGYVPQTGGVLPFLTAKAQVDAVAHLLRLVASIEVEARKARLTEALGLLDHLAKRRSELSGGQRKRVALLTGLATPRALLIADEPTAGLDEKNAVTVLRTLAAVARDEGTAMLIATHDIEAARDAGFAVARIENGVLRREAVGPKAVHHG